MNYYEMLDISSSANTTEIEQAIDARYNQWRSLVTHHDANIVNQANQELQKLEVVRGTLTDANKRSVYDAALGLNGAIGGLADPEAILRNRAPTPNPTPAPAALTTAARTDAWICPNCQTTNAIGKRFCIKCGAVLGRDCPNCGKLIQATSEFCSECGVNVAQAAREKQQREEELAKQRALEQQQLAELRRQEAEREAILGPVKKHSERAVKSAIWGWLLCWLYVIGVPLWGFAFYNAWKVKRIPQVSGDAEYRRKANYAFWATGIPLGLIALSLVCFLCFQAVVLVNAMFTRR